MSLYPSFTLSGFGLLGLGGEVLLALLVIWSICWKGLALWKSARQENKVWFIVFLVINTLGILEILYIYFFSKKPIKFFDGIIKKSKKTKEDKDELKEDKDEKEEKPEENN